MVKAKLCRQNHTKKHTHAHSQKEKKEKKVYIFWEVRGLLPAFSRCSVDVPHVDVFLMYLWGGWWSPCLTPPPSWRSLLYCLSRRLIRFWKEWKMLGNKKYCSCYWSYLGDKRYSKNTRANDFSLKLLSGILEDYFIMPFYHLQQYCFSLFLVFQCLSFLLSTCNTILQLKQE